MLTVVTKGSHTPVPGATVWVRTAGGRVHSWEGMTDDEGRYAVVPPGKAAHSFDITVACAGYVLSGVRSSVGVTDYTLELEPAETIGGTVRDQQGRPIEGARVFSTTYPAAYLSPEVYHSRNSGLAIATTDAQGRWRSNAVPVDARPDARVRVMVIHSDHIMGEFSATVAKTRAFESEQVMKSGLSISGTVLSPFGRPVPRAAVVVGVQPWAGLRPWEGMYFRLSTDRNGQFRTGHCIDPSQKKTVLIVQASGLAWAAREIPVVPIAPPQPQIIRLTQRRPIEGRVVDSNGRPVEGAVVASSEYAFNGLLCWDAETDGKGHFVWYEAPTDVKILLNVFKPPFRPARGRAVDPGSREITITMQAG